MNVRKGIPLKRWAAPLVAIVGLILLLLDLLGVIGTEKIGPGTTPLPAAASSVDLRTARAERRRIAERIAWPATVHSRTTAQVAPKLTARILEIDVEAGDRVGKGEVIARLDQTAIAAQERKAAAALAAAKAMTQRAVADEKRIRALFRQEAATREMFDSVVAQAKSARAQVAEAANALAAIRANRAETVLRAPFDGVIVKRRAEPGDMGLPGIPVAIIQDPAGLRAESHVPTRCARRLHVGDAVTVRIDALNRSIEASVDEIVPEADPRTHTVLIKAVLPPEKGLQPGLFAWLEQLCGERDALLIPETSVERFGQIEAVRVVVGSSVRVRHVRTGKTFDREIEVLSGLRDGDIVVVNGSGDD